MLNINKLVKTIDQEPLMRDISFKVGHGEIAVIIGGSGVGKSTLLRMLAGLIKPDSGTIELDGVSLSGSGRSKVGMVFQQFNLFPHITVERNITLALEYTQGVSAIEARQKAQELLERYQLSDKADGYIHGLSGGEKQRLAIARTLALKPAVICFDEPTSALDPLLTGSIADTLQELATQGYIIVIATHAPHLIERLACTIYLLQDGMFVQSARANDFFAHQERYELIKSFLAGDAYQQH